MRILILHNYYGSESPSGENIVVDKEVKMLREYGHSVKLYSRSSDEIRNIKYFGKIIGASATPWNPFSAQKVSKVIKDFQPDIVHAHNTFPLLSPSVFHAIGNKAAKVLTLHNYRLLCSSGIPLRNGEVCLDCVKNRSIMPSLMHGCYRNSRIATIPIATKIGLHRLIGTWHKKIDAFIVLSDIQKKVMTEGGLPEKKIHIKPNFTNKPKTFIPFKDRKNQVLFVGRLSKEKGVQTLISAWKKWGHKAPKLIIIGDGPDRKYLENLANGLPISFLGKKNHNKVEHELSSSRLLIVPSEWMEIFGLVVIEAFSVGTPAAVSNLGALPSLVQNGKNGVIFESGNISSLLSSIQPILSDNIMLEKLSINAKETFEVKFNQKTNYNNLINIYKNALSNNKK